MSIDTERSSVFGRLVSAYDLESAMVATVKRWINDYLAEIERHHALEVGAIPRPRSYVVSADTEKMPEDQLPAILVESPGLADEPDADGAGVYWAPWTLNLSAQIAARGNRNALRVARLYAAALRLLAVQQQQDPVTNPLDMRRVDWIDERYDLLDSIDDRTICVGTVELRCEVAGVAQRHTGPLDPLFPPTPADVPPDPASPEWPDAITYDLDLVKVAPGDPMADLEPSPTDLEPSPS